jgi:hypothetical protein
LFCGLVAALALATAGNAAAPLFDSTEGAGTYGLGCALDASFCLPNTSRAFSFSAHQLGGGLRASGTFVTDSTNLSTGITRRFAGRVTCMNAFANTAVFAGIVEEAPPLPDGSPLVGEAFIVWVVDNGPAGSNPPDLISPLAFLPKDDPDRPLAPKAFPNVCPQPFPSFYSYFPVTSGNIVVDDESGPRVTG